jgi:hypothetical protein
MAEPTTFAPPRKLRDDMGGGSSAVDYGDDAGFIVSFREEPEFMEYLSKQAGSPVYRNRIMTTMIAPGNTKTVWDHPTTGIAYEMAIDDESGEVHTIWEIQETCENGDVPEPIKYAKAWQRFLKKSTTAADGWPIEEWGVVSRTYAQSLKAQNVHTVQQLAALSDVNAQNIMGAIKYRDLAKAALDERQKTRILSREQERASKAEEQVSMLSKQVADLQASIVRMQADRGAAPAGAVQSTDRAPVAHAGTAPQLRSMSRANANKGRAKNAAKEVPGVTKAQADDEDDEEDADAA